MEKYSRPLIKPWKGIVIHSAGQLIDGIPAIEYMKSTGVGAHFFVNPDGSADEMVPLDMQAYHAGFSAWNGMKDLNQNFIGIEILVEGDYVYPTFLEAIKLPESFKEEQYITTARLCYSMLHQFPTIEDENIVSHSTVSGIDVRPDPKQDPGEGFDMEKLKNLTSGMEKLKTLI